MISTAPGTPVQAGHAVMRVAECANDLPGSDEIVLVDPGVDRFVGGADAIGVIDGDYRFAGYHPGKSDLAVLGSVDWCAHREG